MLTRTDDSGSASVSDRTAAQATIRKAKVKGTATKTTNTCPACGQAVSTAHVDGWLRPDGWQFYGNRIGPDGRPTGDVQERYIRCRQDYVHGGFVHFYVVLDNGRPDHRLVFWGTAQ